MNLLGSVIASICGILMFWANEYISIDLRRPDLTEYNAFIFFCKSVIILFGGPAYLTVSIVKYLLLVKKAFAKYLLMSVFMIALIQDLSQVGKNLLREMRCLGRESEEKLHDVINATKKFYDDLESRIYSWGENLTENEGMMIEKILERSQGLIRVKDNLAKMADKLENMEEVCKRKLQSLNEKVCKEGLKLIDEHVEKQRNIIEHFWRIAKKLVVDAVSNSCEKISQNYEEKSPCVLHKKLLVKMRAVAKEETAEGTEMDSEADTFDVEIEKEFSYTYTNHFTMKLAERLQNCISYIDGVIGILSSVREVMLIVTLPIIFLSTIMDIHKFKKDPSYFNKTVGSLAQFIDKEQKRGVLPLQPEDTGRYSMSSITFSFTPVKENLTTLIMLLIPMLVKIIISEIGEPILVHQEVFDSEVFKSCYQKEIQKSQFPLLTYSIVLGVFVVSVLIESYFCSNLEVALLEFHYPDHKKRRALWLLGDIVAYRRLHIEPRKQFVTDNLLDKLAAHIPWPHTWCFQCHRLVYWNRKYCQNHLCAVLLCSECIKQCLNCKKLKKIHRVQDNNWWKVKKD